MLHQRLPDVGGGALHQREYALGHPGGFHRPDNGAPDQLTGARVCAGCPFTTMLHPAANADAVSPPATEKANGKLLAPKIPTGPQGDVHLPGCRVLGSGWRSGCARSMRASTHEPSRSSWAKSLSWLTVRPRSPWRRPCGSPVSCSQRVSNSSPRAMISSPNLL